MRNWIVDFGVQFEKLNLGGKNADGPIAHVHQGYLDGLHKLMPKIKQWVEGGMFGWGMLPLDWKLVFTGHSIGGAFAVLAATLVSMEGWKRQPEAIVTFGAPRVADDVVAKWWEQKGLCSKILRVNVYNDAIHWLPMNKQAQDEFYKCRRNERKCKTKQQQVQKEQASEIRCNMFAHLASIWCQEL